MTLCLFCRPTVSSWSGNGPESRIKLIGMMGSYSPEAFSVLDNPANSSHFPFRSATNPFCVGDRVEIDPESQMDETMIQVSDHSKDFAKVFIKCWKFLYYIIQLLIVNRLLELLEQSNPWETLRSSFISQKKGSNCDSVLPSSSNLTSSPSTKSFGFGMIEKLFEKIEEEFDIESNHLKNNKVP